MEPKLYLQVPYEFKHYLVHCKMQRKITHSSFLISQKESCYLQKRVTKFAESIIFTGHGLDDVLLKMGEKLLETFQVPWVESETQTFDRTIQINANSKRQDPSCSC